MAEFGKTGVEAISSPVTSQTQPVVDTSSIIETQGLTKTVGEASKFIGDAFDSFITARSDKLLNSFAASQVKLADAVDQGRMTSDEARLRMRSNFLTFTASNPGQFGAAADVQKTIIGTKGLGNIVAEGTEQEQQEAKLTEEAYASGYIPLNATPEEVVTGTEDYLKSVQHDEIMRKEATELQAKQAELNFNKGLTEAESAKLTLRVKQLEDKGKLNLVGFTQNKFVPFSNQLAKMYDDLKSGAIPSVEEAVFQADQLLQQAKTVSGVAAGYAGGTFAATMYKPFEDTVAVYKDLFTDKISSEAASNAVSAKANQIGLMVMQNSPDLALAVGMTTMLKGNVTSAVANRIDNAVVDIFKNGLNPEGDTSNPFPKDGAKKASIKTSFDIILNNMDTGDEEVNAELPNQVSHILRGIVDHQGFIKSPKDLSDAMDFLADDKFGRYNSANNLNSDIAPDVEAVIQTEYLEKVYPLLRDEFTKAKVAVGDVGEDVISQSQAVEGVDVVQVPAGTQIKLEFRGTGVKFVPIEKGASPDVLDTTNSLNKDVSPIINRMLKAQAHLKGKHGASAYKEEWGSLEPRLMQQADTTPEQVSTSDVAGVKQRLATATTDQLNTILKDAGTDEALKKIVQEELDVRS